MYDFVSTVPPGPRNRLRDQLRAFLLMFLPSEFPELTYCSSQWLIIAIPAHLKHWPPQAPVLTWYTPKSMKVHIHMK